jgi:3-dehydroquinate dehydratase II
MKTVLVLNGLNLNLFGTREPGIYGLQTLAGVEELCRAEAAKYELEADCRQSNHEGVLIDWIQEAGSRQAAGDLIGAVFNQGAYTHTSLALHDAIKGAIKGAKLRLIECHISNVHTREEFRSHSFISPAAAGIVAGFGVDGYAVAIHGLHLLSVGAVPA